MSEPLTYAKVDGPPDDWNNLIITDLATGLEVVDVHEVNATEGWLIRSTRNDAGELHVTGQGDVAKERIEGRFEIIRRPRPYARGGVLPLGHYLVGE